jgi:hypothetical protein
MAMGFQCDDVQARMIDLLYGELPGDDRKAVEGHVAGCARCQAELAGFRRTRATVRVALEQSPPARAHDSILRAASAQSAALAAAQTVADKAVRQPAPPQRTSIWEWLRRRWALPTLATIGAVAVFLLASQMFLRPEKMMPGARMDDSVIGEAAPEKATAQKAAPATAAENAPTAVAPVPNTTPARSRVADATEAFAAPEPSKGGGSPVASVKQPSLGRLRSAAGKKPTVAQDRTEDDSAASPASDGRGDSPPARFAPPPPPRAPAAGAIANLAPPHQAAAQPQASKKAKSAESEGRAVAPAPATAAPRALAKAEPAAEAPAIARSPMSDESAGERKFFRRRSEKASAAEDEAETPVQRADRLFARARWAEAAVAYRGLLQQAPDSADAPRWRQRLAAAEKNARDNAGLEPTP